MEKWAISRRDFLRIGGGAGAGLLFIGQIGGQLFEMPVEAAAIPGGTLDPSDVTKYLMPLLIPPVMPRAGTITMQGGKRVDYYEISMRQFAQQVLPTGLPETTVWGYGGKAAQSNRGVLVHHAPSLTIEAQYNRPVRVKWINELVDETGNYLPHLLPVDPTLHWANPPGGTDGRDTRPTFATTPDRYTGPVPIVTHAHGAIGVGDESDGYAEAWYLPAAKNIPASHATEGTWYDFFAAKAARNYGAAWGPGFATFQYPNLGRAATTWYHDHALGMTRLNVYAGPAGFFLIRGGPSRRRRRAGQSHPEGGVTAGTGPEGGRQVPAEQDVQGDPDRDPGPLVQRRRVALLPRHPGLLRRHRGPVRARHRHLADLEPGVLRQHDHRQRQHLAVPERRAVPLPVPGPQRLPVPLLDPRLRKHPRRRGLGDRQ